MPVLSGIDHAESIHGLLSSGRLGLMTNQTGINRQFQSSIDVLQKQYRLEALFAVEHGIRGSIQAGENVTSDTDPASGLPVYSVYGGTHRLTEEMLDAFDILVFDIQDVGARFYTYLYSLGYAMEACARKGKSVLVLDRVDPIGGTRLEGTVLDLKFSSFVGDYELPTRTGLTIGEFARYLKGYLKLDLDLTVAPLTGWERRMYLDDTDINWVAPSPNCQDLEAALTYIGMCVFEGTNISEGRGTTLPFRLAGAPFIDSALLAREMAAQNIRGLHFRPVSFCPTFSKHQGILCHGVQMHITDRDTCDTVLGGLKLMETIFRLWPDKAEYLSTDGRFFLDRLLGTDLFRTGQMDADALIAHFAPEVRSFEEKSRQYRLYE